MDSSDFQCIICQLQCNDADREPMKVCDQQHWVCNVCLQGIRKKASQCPLCNTPLPKNVKKFRTLLNLKLKWDESKSEKQGEKLSKSEVKMAKKEQEEVKILYRSELKKIEQPRWSTPEKNEPKEIKKIQSEKKQVIIPKQEIKNQKKQVLQPLKCSNNHTLIKSSSLPAPYPMNHYGCNGCGQSKIASFNNEVWHCGKCNYDLCKQCSSSQNRSLLRCGSKHPLFKTSNLGLPYMMNRYICNFCRKQKAATKSEPVLHCHACQYDICTLCSLKM